MNQLKMSLVLYLTCGPLFVAACGGSDNPVDPGHQVPAKPGNLVAMALSASVIGLAWTDLASNESGFRVERAPGGTTSFAEIGNVAAGVTSFQSGGLTASTSYSYRVRAFNAVGSSAYSNVASATTKSQASRP